ncbi:M90 family metallopeptidase [uncultured Dechloromonas sp.]|uniref:M90 family metallopeptidase n=1 Tax=uncultured Dechloromonas sp. TaxID=171719 RepID=UPI0025FEFB3C|nr:M90 family metallopeptidase [uncultured Dechloromonas sp.]
MIGLLDKLRGRKPSRIPDDLWAAIVTSMPFLEILSPAEQAQLKDMAEAFLGSKEFSTAGGLELSDEICVSIAAQGCLPILKLGLSAYRDWVGIIVYPDEFVVRRHIEDDSGVVHEYDDVLSGEAWAGGPLIVSWHDVKMAGDGYNVVIHEFAHKLDMLNGDADGMPSLHSGIDEGKWRETFLAAYDDFCRRVDSGEETIIDPYASDTPGEFFAVLSESFFELPDVVADEYPALYDLLVRYYRQDPLARLMKASRASSTADS